MNHINVNDPQHIRTCSLCGTRAARAAVQIFIRTLSESKKTMTETEPARRAAQEELERLRARVRELEAQLGSHDDMTAKADATEVAVARWKDRMKRESARPRRGDNSREAVRIFRTNAGLRG